MYQSQGDSCPCNTPSRVPVHHFNSGMSTTSPQEILRRNARMHACDVCDVLIYRRDYHCSHGVEISDSWPDGLCLTGGLYREPIIDGERPSPYRPLEKAQLRKEFFEFRYRRTA